MYYNGMRRMLKAVIIVVVVALAFILIIPVIPQIFSSSRTIICGGSIPFSCQPNQWTEYGRVPSEGRATYRLYSSISSYVAQIGVVCSPDIGGCWWEGA